MVNIWECATIFNSGWVFSQQFKGLWIRHAFVGRKIHQILSFRRHFVLGPGKRGYSCLVHTVRVYSISPGIHRTFSLIRLQPIFMNTSNTQLLFFLFEPCEIDEKSLPRRIREKLCEKHWQHWGENLCEHMRVIFSEKLTVFLVNPASIFLVNPAPIL